MKRFTHVILGSGVAAGHAVQELAQRNLPKGSVAIVTADDFLPYDRPPLSKSFLAGEKNLEDILINEAAFYPEHGLEVLLRHRVAAVDFATRRLRVHGGEEIRYEKLLIATGSELRRLRVPGTTLEGLYYLRLLSDSEAIRRRIARGGRAVVIGGGFIGLEVSSVLARKGLPTTLIFPGDRVWQNFFTPEMSAWFQSYFTARGVELLPRERVQALLGDTRLSAVQLESGRRVPADFVVAGIGVVPATALFEGTGLKLDQGIVVNEFLETNLPGVWAAGDVTNFPDHVFNTRRHVEHWDNAVQQGRLASRNLAGSREPFDYVQYFFSDVFDLSYEFWGDTRAANHVVYRGEIERGSFSAWWLQDRRLVAAFVLNRPDEERELAPKWIRERHEVDAGLLSDQARPLAVCEPA